jgi:dihydrofolate synthase / folylpolyglutamate synthase
VDIDAFLQTFARFGVNLGLEASDRLLESLDNPQDQVQVVHVAGSNGKGSVCAYLSSILDQAGYRVGRYTSPHLMRWNERICINGEPISDEDLSRVLTEVKAALQLGSPSPTQFEIFTAAMWLHFSQEQVDIAVIEVGLGGRLDATNVKDDALVSVITSISLEHTERLGDTLAKIAYEKAGVLKHSCPAVIGQLPPEANAVVSRIGHDRFCSMVYPNPAKDLGNGWAVYEGIELQPMDDETMVPLNRQLNFQTSLQGQVQLHNAAIAIATIQQLRQQGWDITDADIIDGIAQTSWPGRMQWYRWKGHKILIDGAHNPDSARVLREFIDSQKVRSVHWVLGVLSNKDYQEMFAHLLRPGDSLYLVPVPGHSSAELPELLKIAKENYPNLAHSWTFNDVQLALQAAVLESRSPQNPQSITGQSSELVVLCGSLYLLGHFLQQEEAQKAEA